MAKVLVSIDDDLLRRVDERAAQLGSTRSAYVARLLMSDLGDEPTRRPQDARRALARAREVCARAAKPADATALVRQMRDER